ncbi:MAG: SDR family oxidoreductase [Betaproteobacteria bacterium]|jgi:NAD(P)-dependent dehydrogenase (short-subunit alcohol dehydrogenase family)|nr:SDR family oxidoreductase [Betaproteobacteria bacterium]
MSAARPLCVVTGSASGIGAATVSALAQAGWDTFGLDLQAALAERVALQAALEAPGSRHESRHCDVADESQVADAFDDAMRRFGRIDALVTSAGVVDTTPFMEISVAQFRRIHDVNVIGTWLCMREAARHMRDGGRICAIASIAGLRGGGLSGTAAYAASKGGVIALAKNAARVLAARGIRVNTLSPGATDTPMIEAPLSNAAHRARIEQLAAQQRIGTASEIASGVVYLLSPQASFTHGANLVIDGGIVMQ